MTACVRELDAFSIDVDTSDFVTEGWAMVTVAGSVAL